MGGLVARYYLRYGGAEPGPGDARDLGGRAAHPRASPWWRPPTAASIPSLEALLNGERVGLSYTTLAGLGDRPHAFHLPAASPRGHPASPGPPGERLDADLHDVSTWERFGWGPFAGQRERRRAPYGDSADGSGRTAGLRRSGASAGRGLPRALARSPDTPCPARVVVLGGDCLPTLARAIVADVPGLPPRFEPVTRREAEMDVRGRRRPGHAGERARLAPARGRGRPRPGAACTKRRTVFFGDADHHGIYEEPTFQSVLLRLLLRPPRPRATNAPLAAAR